MERLVELEVWRHVRWALANTPVPLRAALSAKPSVERRTALDRLSRFIVGECWRRVDDDEDDTLPLFPELDEPTAEEDPLMPATATIEKSGSFGSWLLAQAGRDDAIGELARHARADPRFPRNGSPKDVSKRLNELGAEGDLHLVLEDAELDWIAL
jgi:hypothetical protein